MAFRRLVPLLILALIASITAVGLSEPPGVRAAELVTAGYRDHQYGDPAAPGGDDVSAAGNQNKLWFHDGHWFAVMFDTRTQANAKFRIWRFDMATQSWTNTGVAVDDRNRSHADVLAVGNTLYVVSARAEGDVLTGRDLRIYRFGYASATNTYALSAGFPKLIAGTASGTGYGTIAMDDERLWVAYPQDNQVMVSASTDNAANWTAPIVLPTMGNPITDDDMVAIAPMGNGDGVGVMWSNQSATDDAFYFSAHAAADGIETWGARETAPLADPGTETHTADGHISLKQDAAGNLLAAVKTDRNNVSGPNGSDPLIAVFKRTGSPTASGTWATHTVTTVSTGGTRPILVIDDAADRANVFLTHPDLPADGSQSIYRRSAPLSTLDFGASSIGTAVISSTAETAINDATSTAQMTTAASGIIVAATNIPTLRYLHACIGEVCPTPPVADFTGTPTSGEAPLTVKFTDASTNGATAWSWSFGDGTSSTTQNPTKVYADPGTYTVKLTASNVAGSSSKTRTSYITVAEPPENLYVPITPARVLDTRSDKGLPDAFQANVPRTLSVAGDNGIPADAVAITGNLTVVTQSKAGYISITKTPTASPTTSTLNFPVGDNRANGVTVPLNGSGDLSIVYKSSSGASTHVILDVTGYFRESTSGASFVPVTPARIVDTRTGAGVSSALVSGTPRTWTVDNRGGIGSDSIAVTGNVTVVGQTKPGYVSVTPTPVAVPSTSTINFPVGDIRANNFVVKVSGSGTNSATYRGTGGGTTHLLIDVTGYYH